MKSGTTTLSTRLSCLPEVTISKPREPGFFSDEAAWARGLDWYRSLFPEGTPAAGEGTNRYTMLPEYPGVAERMAKTLPDARLIYLVREPIARIRSMFLERYRKHRTPAPSLQESIEIDEQYLATSRYGMQIEPYLARFHPSQLLVVTTDELEADPATLFARVCEHIGVRWTEVDATEHLNTSAGRGALRGAPKVLAEIVRRAGLRDYIPAAVRRGVHDALSTEVPDSALWLSRDTINAIRRMLAPEMQMIRAQVHSSGAPIPPWLHEGVEAGI